MSYTRAVRESNRWTLNR